MRNGGRLQRAAMGALVAVALMAGAGQAGAAMGRYPAVGRYPVDGPSQQLPQGRARIVDGASGGALARIKVMLSSVRILRDYGWEGLTGLHAPAKIVRRSD